MDRYTSGKIEYDFFNLTNGMHKLDVRAWDVHNNSSLVSIEFLVAESEDFLITSLQNSLSSEFNLSKKSCIKTEQAYAGIE